MLTVTDLDTELRGLLAEEQLKSEAEMPTINVNPLLAYLFGHSDNHVCHIQTA
jgi:hypothetical protein